MSSNSPTVDEEFFIDVVEHAPDLICSTDLESDTITFCNQTYADRVGLAKDEVIGESPMRFYHEESRAGAEAAYDKLRAGERVENVEIRVEPVDGEPFWGSFSATPVDEGGESVATRSVIRDISELRTAKEELLEKTERLEQSNRELEQFAYLASHDLQEPLRMVASYTQLLARRYEDELDGKAQTYIDYAVEGAERMKALIGDLLTFSRVNRSDEERAAVDLEEVVEAVEANLRIKIQETDAIIEWEDLPVVHGDQTQLVQLFQNLFENALKFQEELPPRVTIEAERDGDEVRVAVTDNGIGFDPENAGRVFQIFQRLHERGAYEGTGAGLAIVKKVVDFHDGDIEVESEPGEGTTFEFTLPAG